jgi:hypothetical protein
MAFVMSSFLLFQIRRYVHIWVLVLLFHQFRYRGLLSALLPANRVADAL